MPHQATGSVHPPPLGGAKRITVKRVGTVVTAVRTPINIAGAGAGKHRGSHTTQNGGGTSGVDQSRAVSEAPSSALPGRPQASTAWADLPNGSGGGGTVSEMQLGPVALSSPEHLVIVAAEQTAAGAEDAPHGLKDWSVRVEPSAASAAFAFRSLAAQSTNDIVSSPPATARSPAVSANLTVRLDPAFPARSGANSSTSVPRTPAATLATNASPQTVQANWQAAQREVAKLTVEVTRMKVAPEKQERKLAQAHNAVHDPRVRDRGENAVSLHQSKRSTANAQHRQFF
jgi:hypothetical protein